MPRRKMGQRVGGVNDSLPQPQHTQEGNKMESISITSLRLRRSKSNNAKTSSPRNRSGGAPLAKSKTKAARSKSLGKENQALIKKQSCDPTFDNKDSGKRSSAKKKATENDSALDTVNHQRNPFSTERGTNEKRTVLRDWIIKPVPDWRGICVEGQIEGMDDFWHSTCIVDVRTPKLVVTLTGSLYQLKGKINKLLTMDCGISKDVATAFSHGFPANWKEIVKDYYQNLETSITITEECMSPKKFRQIKMKQHSKLSKKKEQPNIDHSILTPTGLLKREMTRSELTTTRSGRISLPPLAGWAGQHYVRRPETNSVQVSFNTDSAKQALGLETQQALALSKREKLMLCQNSLSKSLLVSLAPNGAARQKKNASENKPAKDVSLESNNSIEAYTDLKFQPDVSLVDCMSPASKDVKTGGSSERPSQRPSGNKAGDWCMENEKRNSPAGTDIPPGDIDQAKDLPERGKKPQNPSKAVKYQPVDTKDLSGKRKMSSPEKGGRKKKSSAAEGQSCKESEQTNIASSGGNHSLVLINSNQETGKDEDAGGNKEQIVGKQVRKMQQKSAQRKQNLKKVNAGGSKEQAASDKQGTQKQQKPASRKRKIKDTDQTLVEEDKGKRRKTEISSKHENGWNEEEKDKFNRALRNISSDAPDYWSIVAQLVGTKTEEECLQYHRDSLQQKTQKVTKSATSKTEKKKKDTGRQKGGPIRGGKGTLKRKQDLRDFLDEQNEGYEDDLFEGSPFVKLKGCPVMQHQNIDFNKDDSEIFGSNHNFFTPVAGKNPFDTPGRRFNAKLASVRKTPANQATVAATPFSINSRKHDIYIKNFLDKKKNPSVIKEASPPTQDLEDSILPIKSLFPAMNQKIFVDGADGNDNDKDDHDDDDEAEEDGNGFRYYWSDADD